MKIHTSFDKGRQKGIKKDIHIADIRSCNTHGFHQIIIATLRERKQNDQNTKQQISGYFHINFLCFFTCGSQQSQRAFLRLEIRYLRLLFQEQTEFYLHQCVSRNTDDNGKQSTQIKGVCQNTANQTYNETGAVGFVFWNIVQNVTNT